MRRTILMLVSACCLSLALGAGVAQAQTTYPPPDSPAVEAATGGQDGQDGTAFTGGDESFPVVLAGGLLILGGAALYVARRRARSFVGH